VTEASAPLPPSSQVRCGPLRGVFAAALTPLTAAGAAVDLDAIPGLVDFYQRAGVDGLFVAGTTGESLLLDGDERQRLTDAVVTAAGRLRVAVNVGAQTTAETVRLAEHAAASGAAAVAVAPPPFFAVDDAALLSHLATAAAAVAPLPFYLYEIRQRTGYPIPVNVVRELMQRAPNLIGMKVSDPTLEELERYLTAGLDVLVGAESLVTAGLARGAVGVVSGLAGALPGAVVEALAPSDLAAGPVLGELRAGMERFPFHAAGKLALILQGVQIEPWVRPPLRQLSTTEQRHLQSWLTTQLNAVDTTHR